VAPVVLSRTLVVLDHESRLQVKKIANEPGHHYVWACFGIHPPLYSMMYFPNTTYEMILKM
jgi:hypothetical protein